MSPVIPFGWQYGGQRRPPFAVEPGPGQESVWDYPRPPRLEHDTREVVVRCGQTELVRTRRAIRVMETASPPTFYVPPADVRTELFVPAAGESVCEWKGSAHYWTVVVDGHRHDAVAWSYPAPTAPFAAITDYLSVYPGRLACYVDRVRVEPQPGRFYGGWVTPEVVGPFKGEPGTEGW